MPSMGDLPGTPQGHGTPENGKRDPYYSHIIPISLGIRTWELYGNSILGGSSHVVSG